MHNHVYTFINVVGFDPYCGYFHQPKHGHAALASDLMEEFRSIIEWIAFVINKIGVRPEDFDQTGKGIRFTKEALGRFLTGYYHGCSKPFNNPQRKDKLPSGIELQEDI